MTQHRTQHPGSPHAGPLHTADSVAAPLIFDVESLLLDVTPGVAASLRAAACAAGADPGAERIARLARLRLPMREALTRLPGGQDPLRCAEFGAHYLQHYHESGRYAGLLQPGAVQMLTELAAHARYELHYLTHIGARAAARTLDVYGLQRLPQVVATPEHPCCPAVRAQLLRQLVAASAWPATAWTLLSDLPLELVAAREAGMTTIALAYGRTPAHHLRRAQPDAVADTATEIPLCIADAARKHALPRLAPRHRLRVFAQSACVH